MFFTDMQKVAFIEGGTYKPLDAGSNPDAATYLGMISDCSHFGKEF
jgi:hypothetical protein